MVIQSHPRLVSSLRALSRTASVTVLAVGLLVLSGWALNVEVFRSVMPGLTPMNPVTALTFIFLGIALWLRQESQPAGLKRQIEQVCSILAVLIGVLKFVSYFGG